MTAPVLPRAVGTPLARLEAREKVMGRARYAFEHHAEGMAYCLPVQSTIASGAVRGVDAAEALARDGVVAVVWAENAPALGDAGDAELALFQSREVAYRGQIVAAVVADSLEAAREAAGLVKVDYDERPHDVVLRADHPELYTPEKVNPAFPTSQRAGRSRRRARGRRRVDRRDLHDARLPQQPDGAARDGRGLGARRADALRLHPGRVGRGATRSRSCSSSSPTRCA